MSRYRGNNAEINHLYKKYLNSNRYAVEDLSLKINGGEVFGFGYEWGGNHHHKMSYGHLPFNSGEIRFAVMTLPKTQ